MKLVEWARWWQVRKWVQRTRHFVAALFFSICSMSLLCSCCTSECSCDLTSRALLALLWGPLLSWAFIFSVAFFQIRKGFATQTPPVCCVELFAVVCLQSWQKAPSTSSLYSSQLNSFPSSLSTLFCLPKAEASFYRLLWKGFIMIKIRRVGFINPTETNAWKRRGSASSKERADVHILVQIFDWCTWTTVVSLIFVHLIFVKIICKE